MSVKIQHLGCPGHLIVSSSCRWRRHTQIGQSYRVSSVGDYYHDDERRTIGAGENDFFETMVFRTSPDAEEGNEGCGCLAVISFSEIDGTRYQTAGEAQAGHNKFVNKYRAMATKESVSK